MENRKNYVFTYGTLMRGQRNHAETEGAEYCGTGTITGWALYELGSYPGIVPGEGCVRGELYRVDDAQLAKLDVFEGLGFLYRREQVTVSSTTGGSTEAWVYVYLRSVENCKKLDGRFPYGAEPEDYVWYVAYGSNLLWERFRYYIEGGFCPLNGRSCAGCTDKAMPRASKPVPVWQERYFAKESAAWGGKGIAFLDMDRHDNTLCRAWLITKAQLEEIRTMEGRDLYDELAVLPDIDGIPARTITSGRRYRENAPDAGYLDVIRRGYEEMNP